jgi:hypothetical protein
MVDDRGEDDDTFFRRRPHVNERTRLPFDGELPPAMVAIARGRSVFVSVAIQRDRAGNPTTRARAVFCSDIDGGRA